MMRYILIFLQVFTVAMGGLYLSLLAAGSFTEHGLLTAPSRADVWIAVLRLMPLEGVRVMEALPNLAWIPAITALLALPQGIGLLRHFRWLCFVVNIAALLYVYSLFPSLGTPGKLPPPLTAAAGLFLASAALALFLPGKKPPPSGDAALPAFMLFLLWAGSLGVLFYGAAQANLARGAFTGVAACALALAAAFYCLAKAMGTAAGKGGNAAAGAGFLLVPLLLGAGFFFVGAVPLVLPVAAGVILFFAAAMA